MNRSAKPSAYVARSGFKDLVSLKGKLQGHMYIKQITLEGFKSYAKRTVIKGFDPEFNAITGLNGSGKSNILDSICFVLGITQLSQVRVTNLQGLVYKNGQAGIKKAYVCITFDNRNKDQSPFGYEAFDEITVSRVIIIQGKNKYLINEKTVQVGQIKNFFHSVQLNVNNPHFLIMQGRITKVLNMKPKEILGMIEEAAGTRMYENKKQKAYRTLSQKQIKVNEIEKILSEEITPKLEKLRQEKIDFLKFASLQDEMERVENYCAAYSYHTKNKELNEYGENLISIKNALDTLQESLECLLTKIKTLDSKILTNSNISEAEERLESIKLSERNEAQRLVKIVSKVENLKNDLAVAAEEKQTLLSYIQRVQENIANSDEKSIQLSKIVESTKQKLVAAKLSYELQQKEFEAVTSGFQVSEKGEKSMTVTESLTKAVNEGQSLYSLCEQVKMKICHTNNDLKLVTLDYGKKKSSGEQINVNTNKIRKEISVLDESMKAAFAQYGIEFEGNLNEAHVMLQDCHNQTQKEKIVLENQCVNAQHRIDALRYNLPFHYIDQAKIVMGYDKSDILGTVAINLRVINESFVLAIETVAGAKLNNLIVKSDEIAKSLLKNEFTHRITMLPLNRMKYSQFCENKLAKATEIAASLKGEVYLASSLLNYSKNLAPAILHIFGHTLVCSDLNLAQKISFHPQIRVRTVTFEGDTVNPNGILSGGFRRFKDSVLTKYEKVNIREMELKKLHEKKDCNKLRLNSLDNCQKIYSQYMSDVNNKKNQLSVSEKLYNSSECGTLLKRMSSLNGELNMLQDQLKNTEEKVKLNKLYICKLRHLKSRNSSEPHSRAKTKLESLKNDFIKAELKLSKANKEFTEVNLQKTIYSTDLSKSDMEICNLTEAMQALSENILASESELSHLQKNHTLITENMKLVENANKKIQECRKQNIKLKSEFEKEYHESKLEIQRKSGLQKSIVKKKNELISSLNLLIKQHPWIAEELGNGRDSSSEYNFSKENFAKAMARLAKMKEARQVLSQKLNKSVMGLVEKAETEYKKLAEKKNTVVNDKKTIERVIHDLDEKKKKTLHDTYLKVNRDFGSIFCTLLKGAEAKLVPPTASMTKICGEISEEAILSGLEVKVAFSKGIWKESLSELSGGQRSLLALSLILSFLLFKPAPMYILDEVDAALDLSHTQNIGTMLRKHFKQSQFIVVSLKEGMFNNANVIFRTKFIDGVSTVRKTVGKKHQTEDETYDKENMLINV